MPMVRRIVWTGAEELYRRLRNATDRIEARGDTLKASMVFTAWLDVMWRFEKCRPWEGIIEYRQETDRRKWFSDAPYGN